MKHAPRILIVEDEGIIALDIERQLTRLGYAPVGRTATGEDAVALAATLRPDLVLMDIHLAGPMDGIEAATLIRDNQSTASVFLTAYATDEVVERAKRAEPLGYIIKPFDEYSLRTAIEIALHKDVSDRTLRASEARFQAIAKAATDAIITIDAGGTIVGWSPAAESMFGYCEAEAKGLASAVLLGGSGGGSSREAMALTMWSLETPKNGVAGEIVARRLDGYEFPIERSLAKWQSDEGSFTTAFVRDITTRAQFERSLRLQAAALRAAANAIVITDRNGIIDWVNPAFSALTGFSAAEALGRNPRDLVRSGAHDETFYAAMWDTIIAGRVWEGEITNRRKDGTSYCELQTITPVTDSAGEITHFVAIKRDLTQERRLQEQFLQAQKMEVVGRLAGGIAHDFNNLLTVINGESDLALCDMDPAHPLRAPLTAILDAGSRAARLTAQLLAFSRKQVSSPAVMSAETLLKNLAPMIRRLIGEDITLSLDVAPAVCDRISIDQGQFEQVILNLAVNARDAMPGGGALLIALGASHGRVSIALSDTGTGIPPEVLTRMFEPFFTTKGLGKGTGLGLSTVYSIVTTSGGTLDVESTLGQGTTFTIFLPLAQHAGSEAAAVEPVSRGDETIVLVEDEGSVRDLTARMLRSMGYSVLPMESSSAALNWFKACDQPVHLLLSDVVMPGLTGPELAAAVASIRPRLPVLFASGYADEKLTADVLADPDRFIAKPYQAAVLGAKIRRVIDSQPVR